MTKLLSFIAFVALVAGCSGNKQMTQDETSSSDQTYINPVINRYLADPNVYFENDYFYLLGSHKADDDRYIPIYKSQDLVNWTFVRGAVAQGGRTSWNHKNFWAPEVVKIDGKYHLYYTAMPDTTPGNTGNHVGLAIADNIEGPYEDVGRVLPHSSIDGHPFKDKDGTWYMYYTIEFGNKDSLKAGQIYVDKMISPREVSGKPKQIVSHHQWQEGPFILHRNDKYFLTYSCGSWTDSTYHVRYAIGDSPMGPFVEQPDTVLKTNKLVKGPGHHSLFEANGKDWIVYHGWDTAYTARYPRIDRVFVEGLKITSDGPTYTLQKLDK